MRGGLHGVHFTVLLVDWWSETHLSDLLLLLLHPLMPRILSSSSFDVEKFDRKTEKMITDRPTVALSVVLQ